MSILEDFFDGNIAPSSKFVKKGSKYQKLNKELIENADKLTATLNDAEKEIYKSIEEIFYELGNISEKEYYLDGFCTGAKMTLDVMNFKSHNFY